MKSNKYFSFVSFVLCLLFSFSTLANGRFLNQAEFLSFPLKLKNRFNKNFTPEEQSLVAYWMSSAENIRKLFEFQGNESIFSDIFSGDISKGVLRKFFSSQFGPLDEIQSAEIEDILIEFQFYHLRVFKNIEGDENFSEFLARLTDDEAFESWLNFLWLRGDRDIFLKFWDVKKIKDRVFGFINEDHLTGNKDLLLEWWKEARLLEIDDALLKRFMDVSLKKTFLRIRSGRDQILEEKLVYNEVVFQDPLFTTIIEACRENQDFHKSVKELLKNVAQNSHDSA